MIKTFVILAFVSVTLAAQRPFGRHDNPLRNKVVAKVRSRTALWSAYEPSENPLASKSLDELYGMAGTVVDPPEDADYDYDDDDNDDDEQEARAEFADLPDPSGLTYDNFDGRTQWGNCIGAVKNQGSCGSCWAFSSADVLSDRYCIASNKKTMVTLSPQHLLNCETRSFACSGGYPQYAFAYMASNGIATSTCLPYRNMKQSCTNTCSNGGAAKKYKCKSGSAVSISSVTTQMSNIRQYGPLVATFQVYQDFYNYRSGIYNHVSGNYVGGHAIKVIGWGTTNGVNYWLAENSWGTSWGEKGFFKIKMGTVNFGKTMYGCQADTTIA